MLLKDIKLTREWINLVCPEHGRTSCNDQNLQNGFFTIHEGKLQDIVVERKLERPPRCNRCFLLRALEDGYCDPNLTVEVDVRIGVAQPKFKIVQED